VAAFCFGFTQVLNRKSNQQVGAFRTAFGLLAVAEVVLIVLASVTGEAALLPAAPLWALACFAGAAFFHFGAGWTLLALSQQKVGVARTGALVSGAPLVGALVAASFLDEPLTPILLTGVLVVVIGVALLSLSGAGHQGGRWARPWYALIVAVLWGTSPLLIRLGLRGLDSPLLGLAVGIGATVVVYGAGLLAFRARLGTASTQQQKSARRWMLAGGITGASAIAAQWISFDLTTIAIALSVQQLAALVVVALVPLAFPEPAERLNLLLVGGAVAITGGTALVLLTG
jgi:drug/metabolite transporter (DMT)-like permease